MPIVEAISGIYRPFGLIKAVQCRVHKLMELHVLRFNHEMERTKGKTSIKIVPLEVGREGGEAGTNPQVI